MATLLPALPAMVAGRLLNIDREENFSIYRGMALTLLLLYRGRR